jgi:hypothetical protein
LKFPAPLLIATALLCAPLAAEQSLFRNASIGYGGGVVLDTKAADVDHDGKQDVILFQAVSGSQSACSIITMFGNGDGTFRPPVKTPLASCGSIAADDLDGDGNVDVVLSGYDRLIEIYRGNRDGSFTLRSTKNKAGSILYGGANLLLSDLNGDGKLDLIIPAACCKLTETFRGNGDGTFADSVLQPDFVTGLSDVVAGDFDGDGRTDILVSTCCGDWPTYYGRHSLVTGRGDGNFNAPAVLSTDGGVAVAGDFNGDLKADYMSMGAPNGFAFVHMGKGDGTFTTGATYITGAISRAFPVDLDGDGTLDIVAAGKNIVTVMRGNGDGTFVVNSYVAKPPALNFGIAATFVIADFDGDHHLDVLAGSDATLTFLHGNGDGSLAGYRKAFLETTETVGAETGRIPESLEGLAVADFNGDGKPDVLSMPSGIVIMFNRGDGGFGPPLPLAISNGAPANDPSEKVYTGTCAPGDVNLDGKADIVVLQERVKTHGSESSYSHEVMTYLGNGDGTFRSTRPTTVDEFFNHLVLKDVNGDGRLDALIFWTGIFNNHARLLFSNGDGTFSLPIALPRNPDLIADFNGDGFADYVTNVGSALVGYVLLTNNHGNGTFKDDILETWNRRPIAVGDFNHDGKPDLVDAGYYPGTARMRLGNGNATFTDLPRFTLEGIQDSTKTVTADFDGDGNLDLAFENQVMLGKGDGTFRELVACVAARPPFSDYEKRPSVELAAADIDGNGSDDLLILDKANVAVSTLLTRTTAAGTTPLFLSTSTSMPTLHPGESVIVTVAASISTMNVPSGGIRIEDNGVLAAFATWNAGSASIAVAPPSTGNHTITASYLGDDVFAGASAAVTQTAVKLDTQLQLLFYPRAPQVHGRTQVTADIFPKQTSTTYPSGTVIIREGDTVLFTGPYNTAGYSTGLSYRFPTIGTHTLTLDYSGDANYQAGSVTVAVPVTKAVGTVQLTTSPPSPLTAGQNLTLRAGVTAYYDPYCCEEPVDGGTVTFRDFGAAIGTVTLTRGLASITIQPAAGHHSYSATYNGNVYTDSVSSAVNDYTVDTARRRAVH